MVLISAGVGVTPVLSMLHVLADAESTREVWWLHGARDGAEQPFAGEAAQLLNQLPANHSHICLQPARASTDRLGEDYDRPGPAVAGVLRELGLPGDADAYLCGPSAFMARCLAPASSLSASIPPAFTPRRSVPAPH